MTIESVNRKESTSVPWNLRTVAEAAGDSVVAAAVAEEAEAAEVADHAETPWVGKHASKVTENIHVPENQRLF